MTISPLDESAVMRMIAENGVDAYDVLVAADPALERRFKRVDAALIKLLTDVREHFPDATYYTESGGFNLLLGNSHGPHQEPRQQLTALHGNARIFDGDW